MALAQHNDITVSPPTAGDAVVNLIELTGWSDVLATKTTQGRVWWVLTGSAFVLYSDETLLGSIGTATLTSGVNATISQANSSGITGTINAVFTQSSAGSFIVSYANEADLENRLSNSTSFLASSKWPTSTGSNRFERAFGLAKRMLDGWLVGTDARNRVPQWRGKPDLSALAEPRQLADIHAMLTAHVIVSRLTTINQSIEYIDLSAKYLKEARTMFGSIRVMWDSTRDGQVDSNSFAHGSMDLIRG
jgi:hypothetical protein